MRSLILLIDPYQWKTFKTDHPEVHFTCKIEKGVIVTARVEEEIYEKIKEDKRVLNIEEAHDLFPS